MAGKKTRGNNGKQNKKDRKRPEQQIYRPGMGLQGKTTNKSDGSRLIDQTPLNEIPLNRNSICPTDTGVTSHSVPSVETSGQELPHTMEADKTVEQVKSSGQKSPKKRRPDLQLYEPKKSDDSRLIGQTALRDIPLSGSSICPTDTGVTSQSVPSVETSGQELPHATEADKTVEQVKSSGQKSPKNRRPDLQLYEPKKSNDSRLIGQKTLSDIPLSGSSICPTDTGVTSESVSPFETNGQQLPNTTEVDKTIAQVKSARQMSSKMRRPDLQLYVPKPIAMAKLNKTPKSSSPEMQKPGQPINLESQKELPDVQLYAAKSEDTFKFNELSKSMSPETQKPGELCASGQKEALPKTRNSPEPSKNDMSGLILQDDKSSSAASRTKSADCCCSELSNADIPSSDKTRIKQSGEETAFDVRVQQRQLSKYLSDGLLHTNWNALDECRRELRLLYENIILADPVYSSERNVERSLWNSVYHQIIESLKASIDVHPHRKEEFTQILLDVLDEGTIFYENLLKKLEETFEFSLSRMSPVELLRTDDFCLPESIRVVLPFCQNILIRMGNLAFCKEETRGTARYSRARSYYLKAQQIGPQNGMAYYKLGVVSQQARRKLDALYYYMRCLAANDPFSSAKGSLLSLFDDVKKKIKNSDKRCSVGIKGNSRTQSPSRNGTWNKQDCSGSQQTAHAIKYVQELEQLSAVELNKRFVVSFLDVHRRLFTGAGMETFTDSVTQMLKEFQLLLQCKPLAVGSSRLLQIMFANMFAVHNTTPKDMSDDSLPQNHALNLTLAMVSLIMERSCSMYEEHLDSREYPHQLVSSDLVQLLPAVKVWTTWMLCQRHLWVSAFLRNEEFQIRTANPEWVSLGKLLTTLRMLDTGSYSPVLDAMDGDEQLVLHEDASLLGFYPLKEASIEPEYMKTSLGKSNAENSLRIASIRAFGAYLCGFFTPYFHMLLKECLLLCNKGSEHNKDPKHIKSTISTENTWVSWAEEVEKAESEHHKDPKHIKSTISTENTCVSWAEEVEQEETEHTQVVRNQQLCVQELISVHEE